MEDDANQIKTSTERTSSIVTTNKRKISILQRHIRHLKQALQLTSPPPSGASWMPGGTVRPQSATSGTRSDDLSQSADDATSNATSLLRPLSGESDSDEPEAKRQRSDATDTASEQRSERPPQGDFLPPEVRKAVENTKGALDTREFFSFLYMTQSERYDTVELTETNFTTDIYRVYYQLMELRQNIESRYPTEEEIPEAVSFFLFRLNELIADFEDEIHVTTKKEYQQKIP